MSTETSTPPPAPGPSTSAIDEVLAEYSAAQTRTEREIDAWFFETFHNLPLSTELFNRFNAARDELKRRLRAL